MIIFVLLLTTFEVRVIFLRHLGGSKKMVLAKKKKPPWASLTKLSFSNSLIRAVEVKVAGYKVWRKKQKKKKTKFPIFNLTGKVNRWSEKKKTKVRLHLLLQPLLLFPFNFYIQSALKINIVDPKCDDRNEGQ